MELKQHFTRLGALAAAGAVGMAGALILAAPAQADETTIELNPDHEGKTADYFEEGCGSNFQLPDDQAADEDGWVFVLPDGKDATFKSVTATFDDGDETPEVLEAKVVTTGGSGNMKHAYVVTPAGWTLLEATAVIEGSDATFFNVTHTCPGEVPDGETPTDDQSTPPGDETTSPGMDETSPGEASTSPAGGDTLPTTGAPLTIALVSAAALAAAGGAIFFMMRRRAAQDW